MSNIDIKHISEVTSDETHVFISAPFEANIEDLILMASEQTRISAGLETLEDLVSKIGEEIRRRDLPIDDRFDAAVHETKYEEFQRRYNIQ